MVTKRQLGATSPTRILKHQAYLKADIPCKTTRVRILTIRLRFCLFVARRATRLLTYCYIDLRPDHTLCYTPDSKIHKTLLLSKELINDYRKRRSACESVAAAIELHFSTPIDKVCWCWHLFCLRKDPLTFLYKRNHRLPESVMRSYMYRSGFRHAPMELDQKSIVIKRTVLEARRLRLQFDDQLRCPLFQLPQMLFYSLGHTSIRTQRESFQPCHHIKRQ